MSTKHIKGNIANNAAFPVQFNDGDTTIVYTGLSTREHFAAQFLAALLTHPARSTDGLQECEIAVQYADALIEELSE